MMATNVNEEWHHFLHQEINFANTLDDVSFQEETEAPKPFKKPTADAIAPSSQPLFISTQTKCLYLSEPMDIERIFWLIPIQEYWIPRPGVIKKQKKMVCQNSEEYQVYSQKLSLVKNYYEENIIKMIDNIDHAPEGQNTRVLKKKWNYKPAEELADAATDDLYVKSRRRVKYKNERKLTIGMSKKDILNSRKKKKLGAFYNCFALVVRFCGNNQDFYEFHVKIFNTGKLEIPGRFSNTVLEQIKQMILDILQPFCETPLTFIDGKDGVLINSNFHCGYVIDRDEFFQIIRNKYGIESSYNSSSYQGVKCKFYFNNEMGLDVESQTGRMLEKDAMKMKELAKSHKYTKIAFMVFRTGSCIIVGNCSQEVLYFIYDFIVRLLKKEYYNIAVIEHNNDKEIPVKNPGIGKKKYKRFYITKETKD